MRSYIDGLVQDCSESNALAKELLKSCTKPSISYFKLSNNTPDFPFVFNYGRLFNPRNDNYTDGICFLL